MSTNRKQLFPQFKRLVSVMAIVAFGAGSFYYVSQTFRDHLVFFVTPTDLQSHSGMAGHTPSQRIRLGGVVKVGSIKILNQRDRILEFVVTDTTYDMVVQYQGFLPDLFREGQGVVAEGFFDAVSGIFKAHTILAKHDETYKPPELKKALKAHALKQVQNSIIKDTP